MKIHYRENPKRICCPAHISIFSSKAERELIKYLQEKHGEDNFTHGHLAKYEGVCLNPDVYSKKLKIVIEYDGD